MKCDHEFIRGECIHCGMTPELKIIESLRAELAKEKARSEKFKEQCHDTWRRAEAAEAQVTKEREARGNPFPNFDIPPTNKDIEELWFMIQGVCARLGIPYSDSTAEIEAGFDSLENEIEQAELRLVEARNDKYAAEAHVVVLSEQVQKLLLGGGIALSQDYLSAFHDYGPDDGIQGWEKSRWIQINKVRAEARDVIKSIPSHAAKHQALFETAQHIHHFGSSNDPEKVAAFLEAVRQLKED